MRGDDASALLDEAREGNPAFSAKIDCVVSTITSIRSEAAAAAPASKA
jgi:hypothetical protein